MDSTRWLTPQRTRQLFFSNQDQGGASIICTGEPHMTQNTPGVLSITFTAANARLVTRSVVTQVNIL